MKTTRVHTLMAIAMACGLILLSTGLFAQTPKPRVPAPIGRPSSIHSATQTVPLGPLPQPRIHLPILGGTTVGQSFDGNDFSNSNGIGANCNCYPPDTNAAVSPYWVVEPLNTALAVYDKLGNLQAGYPKAFSDPSIFNAVSGGDPYTVYDEATGRWYLSALNANDDGLMLAVSVDSNPLDGWTVYQIPNLGFVPDFTKMGYNKDAIFLSYNNFAGDAGATVIAIDKAQLLQSSNLVYYISEGPFQFRALPPAQMHGDLTGGVEWFVSVYYGGGNTLRVTKLTNYLSNNPTYTITNLPIQPYGYYANADQPGAPGSVTTNDPTMTQVQYHNGRLVAAMAGSTASDGFYFPKGHYYQVDVHGTPKLMTEGLIDPGPGVSVWMVSVDQDKTGGFGLTWMESSLTEYVSMWIGTRPAIFKFNAINATDIAPGVFMPYSGRTGDYSSTVLDSDGLTFWSANEYSGSDIWNTHIAAYHK